jgi:thioredoxin
MPTQVVTEQNFEQEVLRSELPVLVEFGAEWCGPCKITAPELEALSEELSGKAKVVTVDVDRSPMLAQALRVQSVPALFVFAQGKPVDAAQGAMKKAQLRAMLEPHLPRAAGAITVKEALQLAKQGKVTFVDVREPAVFDRAHIQGAVSFPAESIMDRQAELLMLPSPPLLYCRTGQESQELASRLAESGAPVAFLEGGVLGWEAEGQRLERP